MKKWLAVLLAMALVCSCALAAVSATPNQRLSFRTGPNTKYVELFTLPQSTSIVAYEYEEGNGVTWVLVEFTYDGKPQRAYTGLKRMSVNGSISWASHLNEFSNVHSEGQVYGGPGSNYAYRGWLEDGDPITILRYEGDYAFIEFNDEAHNQPSRGWIPSWMIDGEWSGWSDSSDSTGEYEEGYRDGYGDGYAQGYNDGYNGRAYQGFELEYLYPDGHYETDYQEGFDAGGCAGYDDGYWNGQRARGSTNSGSSQGATKYVIHCNEAISLRVSASTSAERICWIPLGAQVVSYGNAGNGFERVAYNGKTGYALSSYLGMNPPASGSSQGATKYVINCNEAISLRVSASTSAERICWIPLGAQVVSYGNAGNGFERVAYNGKTGYALSQYLGTVPGGGNGAASGAYVTQNDQTSGHEMLEYANFWASSSLKGYPPGNAVDGNRSTAWVEGASGNGIGETLHFEICDMGAWQVTAVAIRAGYHKSEDIYWKNARPKDVTLIFSDRSYSVRLQDVMDWQYIVFDPNDPPFVGEFDPTFILRIDSVYEGSKYTDTAISEVELFAF